MGNDGGIKTLVVLLILAILGAAVTIAGLLGKLS